MVGVGVGSRSPALNLRATQAFDLFDTDKSGSIDYHELKVTCLL
jgi:Ca2+-binding EF-hand superfamily protein